MNATGYSEVTVEQIDKILKDIKFDEPIKYVGDGWYNIGVGDMVILTRLAGVIEFDKALKEAVKNYFYDPTHN